jgi:hypothetical protein
MLLLSARRRYGSLAVHVALVGPVPVRELSRSCCVYLSSTRARCSWNSTLLFFGPRFVVEVIDDVLEIIEVQAE